MTSKRIGIISASALAGALLLGTAGLVAGQDPAATPGPSFGSGVMGGPGMGMMSGQLEQMTAVHDQMVAGGAFDPSQMRQLHAQHHSSN